MRFSPIFAVVSAMFFIFGLSAQPLSAQVLLKERINAWDLMCDTPTGSKSEICSLVQQLSNPDRQNAKLIITIGRLVDDGTYFMRITAPLGVFLPKNITLAIDGSEIGETPFIRCWPNGCMAETPLQSDLLQQLLTGKVASFGIFTSPEIPIQFALELAGLQDGMEKLK